MGRNIDSTMSRLCGRLMSAAQNALETQNYVLEEMEYILEQNPDREDIKACIAEIKAKNKANESANWAAGNHWSEHFDGLGGDEETDSDEDNTSTEDANGDEDDK